MISSMIKTFWQEEDGQDLVEYALLLAFVALAGVSVLSGVGTSIKTMFTGISSSMTAASTAAQTGGS